MGADVDESGAVSESLLGVADGAAVGGSVAY